jgi:hypothetical protein
MARPDRIAPGQRGALLALVAILGAGCRGPSTGERPIPLGPLDVFAAQVEPVLEARCAQGGCHGRADRPFVLFAPGQHRADPQRTHLAEPLTEAELLVNAQRLAVLAVEGAPERSLALRKPLSIGAGGLYHGGGDVFVDTTDAGYRVMARWLAACTPLDAGGGADGGLP